jgi:hypothetical protein
MTGTEPICKKIETALKDDEDISPFRKDQLLKILYVS